MNKKSTILTIITLIVIVIMGVFIFKLYNENKKANKKIEQIEQIISSKNTNTINKEDKYDEEEKVKYIDENTIEVEGEYEEVETSSISNLAIDSKDLTQLKHYKEFKYDFDGDGNTDNFCVRYNKNADDSESNYKLEYNGKKIDTDFPFPKYVYIVDLNQEDLAKEVLVYDAGYSDDFTYALFTVKNKEMSLKAVFDGNEFFGNGKGEFYVKNRLTQNITPEAIYTKYYINENDLTQKNQEVENIDYSPTNDECLFFAENYNVFNEALNLQENEKFDDGLKRLKIEPLTTKNSFKIKQFLNEYEIEVILNDGREGYIVGIDHFAG